MIKKKKKRMKCKPIGMLQEFKPYNCPLNCGLDMSSSGPQILYHALERGAHLFRNPTQGRGRMTSTLGELRPCFPPIHSAGPTPGAS